MMKKATIGAVAAIWALLAAACGGVALDEYPVGTPSDTPLAVTTPAAGGDGLARESGLILGTLMLENTANAVTAAQAGTLLPLFQQLQSLDADAATTDAARSAVLDQIQAALTPDQLAAIAAMPMTQADVFSYLQTSGLWTYMMATGFPTRSFDGDDDGTPPPDRGTPNPDETPGQPWYRYHNPYNGLPPIVLDTLIRTLEQRSQS